MSFSPVMASRAPLKLWPSAAFCGAHCSWFPCILKVPGKGVACPGTILFTEHSNDCDILLTVSPSLAVCQAPNNAL